MEEFLEVINRPKFKRYFNKSDAEQLVELFELYGEMINAKSKVDECRDKKDNFLLALAKDATADYLITGDNDLLAIKKFGSTSIITISGYFGLKSKK